MSFLCCSECEGPTGNEAVLFGPYPSGAQVKTVQQTVYKVFPLRTCTDAKFRNRVRPCLEHQIGRCSAPCVDKVTAQEYDIVVQDVRKFLNGEDKSLIREWSSKMKQAAEAWRYEEAARYRDMIAAAEQVWEKQTVDIRSVHTFDVLGFAWDERKMTISIANIADGIVRESRILGPMNWHGDTNDVIRQCMLQYYGENYSIPSRIVVSEPIEDSEGIAEVLSDRRGKTVKITVPQRGEYKQQAELAAKQAAQALSGNRSYALEQNAVEKLLKQPAGSLHRVECFDISEIQGTNAVGGDVVFLFGEPARELYRRYKIQLDAGENDFAKMHEMLGRRARRAVENKDMPDLIVIDGGKGQLNAALRAFNDLEVEPPLMVGLAKARDEGADDSVKRMERIFLPGRSNPIVLKPGSNAFKFFVRLRDETHQLAIGYHRKFRRADALKGMERIEGLGPKRRRKVLENYKNLEQLRYDTAEQIVENTGIPTTVAESIVSYMKGQERD